MIQIRRPNLLIGSRKFILAAVTIATVVVACSIYANLSFLVVDSPDFRFFPPFIPNCNANQNSILAVEYGNIARALVAGRGFADPFNNSGENELTGSTAWMPPVLSVLLAGLFWVSDGNTDAVIAVLIALQGIVLLGTGCLVLLLARQMAHHVGIGFATVTFLLALLVDFHLWFQFSHDCWLVLLALNLLIAGFCWLQPLRRVPTAALWGVFGGFCALVNPIVGVIWAVLTSAVAVRQGTSWQIATMALAAALAIAPWTVRNYVVFGRLIPIKSNASYELYQSQCLQPDGLIQINTFWDHHPNIAVPNNLERQEYKELGEMRYLDRKSDQFWQAVKGDPLNFAQRVGDRFLGATIWYEPFDPSEKIYRPWVFWLSRLIHPLPFLALLALIVSDAHKRLDKAQWIVIGVYVCYLLPYILVSYYDRYGAPLLGVKVLLVIWAIDRLLLLLPAKKSTKFQASAVPQERNKSSQVNS